MASAAPKDTAFKVSVSFESREDGGLRAFSKDVPGFVLSNRDCDTVLAGVESVLEIILSDMFNAQMRVTALQDMRKIRNGLEKAGIVPPSRANAPRIKTREYVGMLAHA